MRVSSVPHVPQLADKGSNVDMNRMKPGMSFLQVKASMKMQECHMCQLERDSPYPAGSCSWGRQPAQAHRYVWERALGCQFKGSSLVTKNTLALHRGAPALFRGTESAMPLSLLDARVTVKMWHRFGISREENGTVIRK
jgi:hypothetical protein